MTLPRIALSVGEPAGIGPELVVRLAAEHHFAAELVAIADPDLLKQHAKALQIELQLVHFDPNKPQPSKSHQLSLVDVKLRQRAVPGQLNPENAAYVLKCLATATQLCMDRHCDAVCTAPVHKGIINDAGITFSGHTEFFAERTHTAQVVMMLQTYRTQRPLRVALATTHLPLRDVAAQLSTRTLEKILHILHQHLRRDCAIEQPCILVAGLNPHAGENGHLGTEEITIINPAIHSLQQQGMNVQGSYPADTLFTPPHLQRADAFLAMYHDQGLPVLKYAGFHSAANITLGLPFIRTSVDHGTALELVGTGQASTASLHTALQSALDMIKRRA